MAIEDITGNELDIPQARVLKRQKVGYHSKPVRKTAKMFQIRNHLSGKLNWYSVLEAISLIGAVGIIAISGPKVAEGI